MMLAATSCLIRQGKKEMSSTQSKESDSKREMDTLRRVMHAVIATEIPRAGCQDLHIRSRFYPHNAYLLLWSK
jgi:hypothetical protein